MIVGKNKNLHTSFCFIFGSCHRQTLSFVLKLQQEKSHHCFNNGSTLLKYVTFGTIIDIKTNFVSKQEIQQEKLPAV